MTTVRIIFSAFGIVVGYSALIAFILLKNYPAAVLGFLSGIANCILTFLHLLVRRQQLTSLYDAADLRQISRFGYTILTMGVLSLVCFITLEILLKPPIMPVEGSYVMPIVFSVIVGKSGLLLFLYSRSYINIEESESRLVSESNEQVESGEETAD